MLLLLFLPDDGLLFDEIALSDDDGAALGQYSTVDDGHYAAIARGKDSLGFGVDDRSCPDADLAHDEALVADHGAGGYLAGMRVEVDRRLKKNSPAGWDWTWRRTFGPQERNPRLGMTTYWMSFQLVRNDQKCRCFGTKFSIFHSLSTILCVHVKGLASLVPEKIFKELVMRQNLL